MTLKTFYPKLLWNTLMKRCWYGAASFLLMFIVMPLNAMMSFESAEEFKSYTDIHQFVQDEKLEFMEFVCGSNLIVVILVIALALLGAWSGLAWLHSRKQMDLYGSLPVKREVLYGMECAAAVLWFLFSYVVNFVLTILVAVQKGIFTGEALKLGIYSIGIFLLGFLAVYFCGAVAMMLTGKVLTGILGTLVFLGIAPVTILLLIALPDLFFISYISTSGVWEHIAMYSSPVVIFFNIINDINAYVCIETVKDYVTISFIVAILIWIVAESVVSVILLKIRPSEGAEQSMVFPKTEGIIKGCILYPIAIGGALFFWSIRGNYGRYGWLWFGLFFVSFVISILIEIIYHHDRKRIFKHKLSTGISVGASVITILIFQFDIFGIDSWIPEEENVESMVLLSDLNYSHFQYPDGSYNVRDYLRNNMDQTSGDYIYDYLDEGLELLEIYRDARNGDAEAEAYLNEHGWGESVTVVFKLKNGSTTERCYFFTRETLESLHREMFEEELYKAAWLPMLYTEDNKYHVTYLYYGDEEIDISNWSKKENREFVNIYKEELKTMSYDQIFKDEDSISHLDFESDEGEWVSGTYPFSKNFVKCFAYIEALEKKEASSTT